jgi:hypothetical protein
MPRYNVLGIARHTVPNAAMRDVLKRATAIVIESGGMVESVDNYGTKALAYRIGQSASTGPRVCSLAPACCDQRRAAGQGKMRAQSRVEAKGLGSSNSARGLDCCQACANCPPAHCDVAIVRAPSVCPRSIGKQMCGRGVCVCGRGARRSTASSSA